MDRPCLAVERGDHGVDRQRGVGPLLWPAFARARRQRRRQAQREPGDEEQCQQRFGGERCRGQRERHCGDGKREHCLRPPRVLPPEPRRRVQGPLTRQTIRRALCNGGAARALHEGVEPSRCGQAELSDRRSARADQVGETARCEASRRDQPHRAVPSCQCRHAGGGRLDQPCIGKRAGRARQIIEIREGDAEVGGERPHVGFLVECAHGDERPVRARAKAFGAQLGEAERIGADQLGHAMKFGTAASRFAR